MRSPTELERGLALWDGAVGGSGEGQRPHQAGLGCGDSSVPQGVASRGSWWARHSLWALQWRGLLPRWSAHCHPSSTVDSRRYSSLLLGGTGCELGDLESSSESSSPFTSSNLVMRLGMEGSGHLEHCFPMWVPWDPGSAGCPRGFMDG